MICIALCTLLCVVFVTYVIVAYTFLKYPSLVPKFISGRKNWKHENRFRDVVHISHRGKLISVIIIMASIYFNCNETQEKALIYYLFDIQEVLASMLKIH